MSVNHVLIHGVTYALTADNLPAPCEPRPIMAATVTRPTPLRRARLVPKVCREVSSCARCREWIALRLSQPQDGGVVGGVASVLGPPQP